MEEESLKGRGNHILKGDLNGSSRINKTIPKAIIENIQVQETAKETLAIMRHDGEVEAQREKNEREKDERAVETIKASIEKFDGQREVRIEEQGKQEHRIAEVINENPSNPKK